MASSRLSIELYNKAKYWAGRWTQLAKNNAFSTPETGASKPLTHIKIATRVEKKSPQRFALILIATGKAARAYEYGSGIHAQIGPKNKIPILPKKAKFLTFFWEKAWDNIPRTKEGKVMLKSVQHPGVEAASGGLGYIRPAADDLLIQARRELTPLAQKAIVADLYMAFKSGRKR